MKKMCAFLMLLLICGLSYAKAARVRSMQDLRKKLATSEYSIVLFTDKSRDNMRNAVLKNKIKDMEAMFSSLSESDYYTNAKLQFIEADVNKRSLVEAPKAFRLYRLPALMIFFGRQPDAKLYGFVYRDTVERFINQHLSARMNRAIKEFDEQRKRDLEKAKIKAYNRDYIYGPYGYGGFYPYWSYGFGWPRYYGYYYW